MISVKKFHLLFLILSFAGFFLIGVFPKSLFAAWETDFDPPFSTFSVTGPRCVADPLPNTTRCTNSSNATVAISCSDAVSDCSSPSTYYKITPLDGAVPPLNPPWTTYSGSFPLPANQGSKTIYAYSLDNAGNIESPKRHDVIFDSTISGRVYDDPSGNCTGNTGAGGAEVTVNCPSSSTTTNPSGNYDFTNLTPGWCIINARKPNYILSSCVIQSINLAPGANTKNLYLRPSGPWFQGKGGDMRLDNGFSDRVPLGNYALLDGNGATPGVIFSGDITPNFSPGYSSSTMWVAGPPYPEVFTPVRAGVMRTSYAYYDNLIGQNKITPFNLANYCGGPGLNNCTLQANLPNGVHKANGDVRLNSYAFPPNKNYVILVNGDLTLRGDIDVPIGSTVTFSVSGDIIVDRNVGQALASSINPNLEGFYSADQSFVVEGNNNCGVGGGGADKRLNIGGAVVVNVKTNPGVFAAGSFSNQRDLCGGNSQYPSVFFNERPDFILNAPAFIKHPNFIWQEVAP